MKKKWLLLALLGSQLLAQSQQNDTVTITPKDINTKVLIPGMHRWLVYFKMGKDSSRTRFNLWSRKIDLLQYQGRDAISVTQEWENNDSITHTVYTVCDRKDFSPLYQESWTKPNGKWQFDFLKKEMRINDKLVDASDTGRANTGRRLAFETATKEWVLDWHLDLEVFPLLPFKEHTTFLINFYDPGFPAPKLVPYTVTGSGKIKGYDNQEVDCWLMEHPFGKGDNEIFWISKKTREVLKLEQSFAGRFRYKIKLGFSI